MCAVGVGHFFSMYFTFLVKVILALPPSFASAITFHELRSQLSCVSGVGHISILFFNALRELLPPSKPVVFGVWKKVSLFGNNPDPFSFVVCANIGC
jgi:hypothetical protein